MAVLFKLDYVKTIDALGTEMQGSVGEFATAVLPPFMTAGVIHNHLSGFRAAAHLLVIELTLKHLPLIAQHPRHRQP